MDTLVQLLRNGLCCIKDLNLYPGSKLYDIATTASYYKFASPLDETTPLDLLIAICQLYAVISLIISGYHILINESFPQWMKYNHLYDYYINFNKSNDEKVKSYLDKYFQQQISLAKRNIVCGVCVLSTGIAFFWLFLSSLHVTQTGFLGGVPGLIHALEVTEVALFVLLYYMYLDVLEKRSIVSKVKTGSYKDEIEWYDPDWQPFWKDPSCACATHLKERNTTELDKNLQNEIQTISKIMKQMEKDENWTKTTHISDYVENLSHQSKKESYCNLIYFILNLLAFLGYGLCVLCYYYPNSDDLSSLKFGFETHDADWWGNFVGDFCWTIEPFVIAFSPLWIYSKKKASKAKME